MITTTTATNENVYRRHAAQNSGLNEWMTFACLFCHSSTLQYILSAHRNISIIIIFDFLVVYWKKNKSGSYEICKSCTRSRNNQMTRGRGKSLLIWKLSMEWKSFEIIHNNQCRNVAEILYNTISVLMFSIDAYSMHFIFWVVNQIANLDECLHFWPPSTERYDSYIFSVEFFTINWNFQLWKCFHHHYTKHLMTLFPQ